MGIFKQKTAPPQAQNTQLINNLRVNESVRGKVVPVSLGTNRQKQFLLWAGDFQKISHTTTQHVPGGLSGGGGNVTNTTFTYQTAYLAGLGFGKIDHISNVWDSAGKVAAVQVTETHTVPVGGGIIHITPPNGGRFGGSRGVAFAQAFSQTVNDFGSDGPVTLSGTFQVPFQLGTVAAPGVVAIDPSTGDHTFDASDAGKSVTLSYTANLAVITKEVELVVPGSLTFTVDDPSTYIGNSSIHYDTGAQLFGPASSPVGLPTGQYYADNAGNFTFASGDLGRTLFISYQASDPNVDPSTSSILNFSLTPGTEGQSPWSYLTGRHADQAVGYSGVATVQSPNIQLGSGGEMPQLSFETVGPLSAGGGIIDCNPSDVLYAYLTDHLYGIEFPTDSIDWSLTAAAFNQQDGGVYLVVPIQDAQSGDAATFWAANNFFISPLIENQTTVAQEFQTILDAGQCAVIWSEGKLKLRPYGDTSAAANGAIYQPLTQPVVELGIDDFVVAEGEDPIKVTRSAWNGAYNKVQIQFQDRANGYNPEVVPEEDLASIQMYGEHVEDVQNWDFIKTPTAAQWAANLRVKRLSNIRNTYEFTIPCVYDYLEAMDLVTLTADQMGFSRKPVRITKIEDDPENGLLITAEDFPYGIAKPTLYPKQTSLAVTDFPGLADPGNSEPLILELPDQFTQYQGYTLRIYAAPDTPGNWGGADVWLSGDNVEFDQVGTITTPALMGVLTSSMAAGTGDPETGTSITVEISSSLQLLPVSQFNFDSHNELSLLAIIDAGGTFEIVGYRDATLIDANTYQVSTFHRGLFGTTRAAHASGAKVVKMDQGHLEITYPSSQVGETSYVKLTSFNSVGGRLQDISTVASNSFVLTGAFPGFFDKTSGQLFSMSQVRGAGALATKNSVDLATGDVTNKVATNILYSGGASVDSLKPAESGAEKTTGKSLTVLTDRHLGNLADDATSGRFAVSGIDANRKALIDFNSAHTNQGALSKKNQANLDLDITDGTSFVRTTPNEKTGAGRGFNAIDSGNIIVAGGIDFSRSYTNKHLGNIPDDGTSGRFAGLQAGASGDGFQILSNPDFTGGSLTGYSVYDNAVSGKVTHTAVQDSTTPNSSGWNLQITTASGTPAPNPGLGGFFRGISVDSGAFAVNTYHKGATIIWRVRANIPVGASIQWSSNATGTGGTFTWLTSRAGTGAYFEYVGKQVIGTAGTFSSTGFFYLDTGTAPITWNVAMCSAVCISHPAGFGVADIDPNRRAIIDLSQLHLNKTVDFLNDGTSFVRTTPNEKTGAGRGFNAIDGSNIIVAGGIDFSRSYTNKHLGNIPDGGTRFAVAAVDANKKALIDFSQAGHVNRNQDNIPDGTTFKRLANVASDNTIHVSTSLNAQGSILPNQGILITFQALPTLIVGSWNAQSLLRSDSSSLTVNSSSGASVVLNGGGESGTVGAAAPNWGVISGFGPITVNDAVVSGSQAIEINNTSGNTSIAGQTVSVTGGVTYVLEGWIKTDALPTVAGHGGFLDLFTGSGVSSLDVIGIFNASGTSSSTSTSISMGWPAAGTAEPYAFFQAFFIPSGTGQVIIELVNQSNGGRVWWDNIALYQFSGAVYRSLTASHTYHLYPYCQVSSGNLLFSNGNPPPTSASDTFAQQTQLDGRVGFQPCSVTTPASGTTTPNTGTGGGSGTCPEFNEPVEIQRYSDDGELIFEGTVKAGEVKTGYESDDGTLKRGDFLKGYSFAKQQDVYRAVQKAMLVHCNGWVMIDGHRVTACEHVFYNGQWMPAWKVPGATHDKLASWKVLIQVEADWDDEHNYWLVGREKNLLIHNVIILPC